MTRIYICCGRNGLWWEWIPAVWVKVENPTFPFKNLTNNPVWFALASQR